MDRRLRSLSPLLLALTSVGIGGVARAGDPPAKATKGSPAKAPKLWVKTKELDFGEVMHGQLVKLDVPVENRGDAPLLLREVKPSCDCTVAGYPKRIEPGKRGVIKLQFDSNKRPAGYQSFRVAIYSNDPTQVDLGGSCTLLSLRGEVRTLYRKSPHGAYFGEFIQGLKPVTKTIYVTGMRQAKAGFTAKRLGTLPSYLKVAVTPITAADAKKSRRRGRGVKITIQLLPHAPVGSIMQWVDFETSLSLQPRFRIMVSALVNRRITGPPAVNFGGVARGKGAERLIGIERRDGAKGIPISKLRFDHALLEVERRPLGPTRIELEVRVKKDARPGPFASFLDVLLDDPNQRIVRIPIYGRVVPKVLPDPPVVLLPKALREGKAAGEVKVHITGKGVVRAAEVVGEVPLQARVETRDGLTRVWLIAKGAAPAAWPDDAALVLTTNVPGEERVRVPLVGP